VTGHVIYARTSTDDIQGAMAKTMGVYADDNRGNPAIVSAQPMLLVDYERRLPGAPLARGSRGNESSRP